MLETLFILCLFVLAMLGFMAIGGVFYGLALFCGLIK